MDQRSVIIPPEKTSGLVCALLLVAIMMVSAMSPALTNELQDQLATGHSGTGVITGYVYNEQTKVPLVEAAIERHDMSNSGIPSPSTLTWTDTFGYYQLDGVPSGIQTITVTPQPGYSEKTQSLMVEGEEWNKLDFLMYDSFEYDAYTVEGLVQDVNTALPLAGAKVALESVLTGNTTEYTTDESGTFVFEGIRSGGYEIEASHPNYISVEHIFAVGWPVEASKHTVVFDLKVERPGTVSGVVTGNRGDQNSAPISDSLVTLWGMLDGEPKINTHDALTDDNGRYEFTNLPHIQYKMIVETLGYNTYESIITIEPDSDIELDIDLNLQSVTVEIDVSSSIYSDMPVEGISIDLNGMENTVGAGVLMQRVTDADGKATFNHLVPTDGYVVKIVEPILQIDDVEVIFNPWTQTISSIMPNSTISISVDLTPELGNIFGNVKSKKDLLIGANTTPNSRPEFGQPPATLSCNVEEINFPLGGGETTRLCPELANYYNLESASINILSAELSGREIQHGQTTITTGVEQGAGDFSFGLPPGHYELEFTKEGHVTKQLQVDVNSEDSTVLIGQDYTSVDLNAVYVDPDWSYVVAIIEKWMAQDSQGPQPVGGLEPLSNITVTLDGGDGGTDYVSSTNEFGIVIFEKVVSGYYTLMVDNGVFDYDETSLYVPPEGKIKTLKRNLAPAQYSTLKASWTKTYENDGSTQNRQVTLDLMDEDWRRTSISFDPNDPSFAFIVPFGNYKAYFDYPNHAGPSQKLQLDFVSAGQDIQISIDERCDTNDPAPSDCWLHNSPFSGVSMFHVKGNILDRDKLTPLEDVSIELTVEYCRTNPNSADGPCYRYPPTGSNHPEETTRADGFFDVGILPTGQWISNGEWVLKDIDGDGKAVQFYANKSLYEFVERDLSYLFNHGIGFNRIEGFMKSAGGIRGDIVDDITGELLLFDTRVTIRGESEIFVSGDYRFDPLKPGPATLTVEKHGYYPYELVIDIPKDSFLEFDISLEKIPPPTLGEFSLNWKADGKPISGFVLIGVRENEWSNTESGGLTGSWNPEKTQAVWDITVDRGPLNDGFSDPVRTVVLALRIKDNCEFTDNELSGSFASYVRSPTLAPLWGTPDEDTIELHKLPCGNIEYQVTATTVHGITAETEWDDFPVKPAMPTGLLWLFARANEVGHSNGPLGKSYGFGDSSASKSDFILANIGWIEIERRSENSGKIVYAFKEKWGLGINIGSHSGHKAAKWVNKNGYLGLDFEVSFTEMSFNKQNGAFIFTVAASLKACEKIYQKAMGPNDLDELSIDGCVWLALSVVDGVLISIDHPSAGNNENPGKLKETIGGSLKVTYQRSIPWVCPPPGCTEVMKFVQIGLSKLGIGTTAAVSITAKAELSWILDLSSMSHGLTMHKLKRTLSNLCNPNPLTTGTTTGIECNFDFDIKFELKIKAGTHGTKNEWLKKLTSTHGNVWASIDGEFQFEWDVELEEDHLNLILTSIDFVATAKAGAAVGYLFFTANPEVKKQIWDVNLYKKGTNGSVHLSHHSVNWSFEHLSEDSLNRSILTPMNEGNLRLPHGSDIALESNLGGSNYLGFSILDETDIVPIFFEYNDVTAAWDELPRLDFSASDQLDIDPKIVELPNGKMMAVWTTLSGIDEDNSYTGIIALSNSDIYYSIYTSSIGAWSEPEMVPSVDSGANILPVLSSDGDNTLLVWSVDRDGNLFTTDDRGLFFSTWDSTSWSQPSAISGTSGYIAELDVVESDGKAMLTYVRPVSYYGFNTTLVAHLFDGESWGPATNITTGTDEDWWFTTSAAGDGFSLSWIREGIIEDSETRDAIYSSSYHSGVWGEPVEIHSAENITDISSTKTREDYSILTWSETDGINHSIRAKTYDNMVWNDTIVEVSEGRGVITELMASMDVQTQDIQVTYIAVTIEENSTEGGTLAFNNSRVSMPERVVALVDDPPPIRGCTDSEAINYNSKATVDDNSCKYGPTTPPPWWLAIISVLILLGASVAVYRRR